MVLSSPSPSQRLSLRGRSPSGAEPEPAATLILPPAYRQAGIKGEENFLRIGCPAGLLRGASLKPHYSEIPLFHLFKTDLNGK